MTSFKLENALAMLATLVILGACGNEPGNDVSTADDAASEVQAPAFPTAALIDPNEASQDALAAIPGINDAAVQAILAARPFSTPSELDAAIGESLNDEGRKAVYALLFVKVGLNSGAEEDYKLIPSTMPAGKLAHEFEEYRPYDSMEQFSREMSKYVSGAEVAYLARFVTLD
jgi:radical SAM superfamily enzyme with C-terminal helix-hairpin-helix motif